MKPPDVGRLRLTELRAIGDEVQQPGDDDERQRNQQYGAEDGG